MQPPDGSDPTRLDRIERSIEALASTAAGFFTQMADQQAQYAQQQAEHGARMNQIQAKHEARLNDHEDAILDVEAEHRRLLRAQVLIADELREIAATQRETTEKLNGLIAVVDDFIRRQPKQ